MNKLRTELDKLEDTKLKYVIERSQVYTDADGYRNAGIPKATFYSWDAKERDKLNDIAQQFKRDIAMRIITKIEASGEAAADTLISQLKSRNESIKQKASIEIINRLIGTPTQKQEITGKDGEPFVIKVKLKDGDD